MLSKVNDASTVTIEYSAKLKSGEKILSSEQKGPMTFKLSDLGILPGLNSHLIGMGVGDHKKFELSPSQAFGEYFNELVMEAPLDKLPDNISLGMQLSDDTRETFWTVVKIDEDESLATLDGNHVLAGKFIDMEVKLIEIR